MPMHRKPLWMLMLLCSAAPLSAVPPDAVEAAWVLQKIARPSPLSTGFVELRGSSLLKAPLRLEGRYTRPDKETLVREVVAPYRETTTIRDGEVTLQREGKPSRTFPLSRVPELAGLQRSFGALLAGEQGQLEQQYTITAAGTPAHWQLTMLPKDAALAQQLQYLQLHGRGAELRCIETQPVKGDLQRTLLGGAARDAVGVTELPALVDLCGTLTP